MSCWKNEPSDLGPAEKPGDRYSSTRGAAGSPGCECQSAVTVHNERKRGGTLTGPYSVRGLHHCGCVVLKETKQCVDRRHPKHVCASYVRHPRRNRIPPCTYARVSLGNKPQPMLSTLRHPFEVPGQHAHILGRTTYAASLQHNRRGALDRARLLLSQRARQPSGCTLARPPAVL